MKTAIVLGTRPEIIKLAPMIRALHRLKEDFFVIHTGQHYSYDMDKIFFEDLNLLPPKYHLNLGSGTHAELTGKIMIEIEKILIEEKPDVVATLGDTNTVLATTLAATKLKINVAHIEAGLRSGDWRQPEEKNRIAADHLSNFLFPPTPNAVENLKSEGLPRKDIQKMWLVGNLIVDSVKQNLELGNNNIFKELGIEPKQYFLATMHREENVDSRETLTNLLIGLDKVYKKFKIPLVYPMHPRTKKRLAEFNLKVPDGLKIIDPLGYLTFLRLELNAILILTDSGGVQEEACILGVPCVVLRDFSDRPETIEVGAAKLVGSNPEKILSAASQMLNMNHKWENPFGDGKSAEHIIKLLKLELN